MNHSALRSPRLCGHLRSSPSIAHYQTNPRTPFATPKTRSYPAAPAQLNNQTHQSQPAAPKGQCDQIRPNATSTQNAEFRPPILTPEIGCPPRHADGTLTPLDLSPLQISTA